MVRLGMRAGASGLHDVPTSHSTGAFIDEHGERPHETFELAMPRQGLQLQSCTPRANRVASAFSDFSVGVADFCMQKL